MERDKRVAEKGIKVNDSIFTVKFFFASDWQFMAKVTGLKASNAKFFCPWCCCRDVDRETLQDWGGNFRRNLEQPDRCNLRQTQKSLADNPSNNLLQGVFSSKIGDKSLESMAQ